MKHILLTLIISLYLVLLPAGAETSISIIPPPKNLMCTSSIQCDSNPKRLEQFVSEFYIWYVSFGRPLQKSIPSNIPHNQQYKIYQKQKTVYYSIYKNVLTDDFYNWYITFDQTENGIFPARFCAEDDLDPFLCARLIPELWPTKPIAKVIASDWQSIKLAVTLPEWIDTTKVIQKSHTIFVYLKPFKNELRIDRVTNFFDNDK